MQSQQRRVAAAASKEDEKYEKMIKDIEGKVGGGAARPAVRQPVPWAEAAAHRQPDSRAVVASPSH